jgi:hypothetical protein
MEKEFARLSSCAAVASLYRDQDGVEPEVIKRGICSRFGVLLHDVKVVRHRPEDFFIDSQRNGRGLGKAPHW